MEEVIKYFESLEARISALEQVQARDEDLEARVSALEQTQKESVERLTATVERLRTNESKLLAVGKHVASMVAILEDLRKHPQVLQEEKPVSKPKPQPVVEPVVEPEVPEMQEEPAIEETPEIQETPQIQETPEPEIEPIVEEEVAPAVEPEVEPVAEPVVEEPVTEEQASPKAVLYGKPVDDISLAISLGDRFLYQRELFGQNAELMQRTLDKLNGMSSFDEALTFITNRFQWDTESKTYQQFIVTLHRRFG